jgi:hypothetical protein
LTRCHRVGIILVSTLWCRVLLFIDNSAKGEIS